MLPVELSKLWIMVADALTAARQKKPVLKTDLKLEFDITNFSTSNIGLGLNWFVLLYSENLPIQLLQVS